VPGVHECAVVARRHAMLDEVPVAFVIATGQVPPDALREAITQACARQLADFKRPHELRLVDSMPRSTLEKVAKAQLRAMLESEA
jgi:crotonobetaine/carnitine-CoA ligase